MDEFQLQLQELIAKNKIPQVIKILLETLQKCQSKNPESRSAIAGLRNQVVLLSSRYNDNNEKVLKGIMDPILANTAKNQLISSFLDLISHLPDHTEFANYINHREEEEAWEKALEANTIEDYKTFFTQYPNGKYKDETQRVIKELKKIQSEKEKEIKQKAEEEKERRFIKEQQEIKEREQASNELLRKEKEQVKITNNKNTTSEEIKKAQQELDEIKKEKAALLAKKKQTMADLQKVEEQRKAAAIRQKPVDPKKKEPTATSKTKHAEPVTKKQAAAAVTAAAITNTSEQNQSFFGKLFNKNNRWWVLTSLILPSITGAVFGVFESASDGENIIFFFLGLTFFSYIFLAIKFPLKPAWHSLIATFVGALLFCVSINATAISSLGNEFFQVLLIVFFIVSVFVLPICFFRNRSIAKRN